MEKITNLTTKEKIKDILLNDCELELNTEEQNYLNKAKEQLNNFITSGSIKYIQYIEDTFLDKYFYDYQNNLTLLKKIENKYWLIRKEYQASFNKYDVNNTLIVKFLLTDFVYGCMNYADINILDENIKKVIEEQNIKNEKTKKNVEIRNNGKNKTKLITEAIKKYCLNDYNLMNNTESSYIIQYLKEQYKKNNIENEIFNNSKGSHLELCLMKKADYLLVGKIKNKLKRK